MCLAIPSKVVEIRDNMATIDVSGVRRDVSLLLLPEEAAVGDYVLVHAGFAIQRIDPGAAEEAMKLIREVEELGDGRVREIGFFASSILKPPNY